MRITMILVWGFALFISGCIPMGSSTVWIKEGESLKRFHNIEIADTVDMTQPLQSDDISKELTELIKKEIALKGYSLPATAGTGKEIILVRPKLIDYSAGSALQRWAAPGAGGATRCTVRSVLEDKASGQIVGEILTTKEIRDGGLYSIGAESVILKAVATDIAEQLEKTLGHSGDVR